MLSALPPAEVRGELNGLGRAGSVLPFRIEVVTPGGGDGRGAGCGDLFSMGGSQPLEAVFAAGEGFDI